MAISRAVGLARTTGSTDATTGNLALPALTTRPATTNDSLALFVYGQGGNTSTLTVAGWSAGPTFVDTSNLEEIAVFYKVASSADIAGTASYAINSATPNVPLDFEVEVITNGVFDTSVSGHASSQASGTPITLLGSPLVPSTTSDLVYVFVGSETATTTGVAFSTPTNYSVISGTNGGPPFGYSWYLWYRLKADSSSENPQSTPTFTGTPGSTALAFAIAFKSSVVVGPISVSGQGSFSGSTALSVTDPNNTGTITATVGNTGVATVSPASGTGAGPLIFTVTAVAAGTTYITFADSFGNQNTQAITVTSTNTVTITQTDTAVVGGSTDAPTMNETRVIHPAESDPTTLDAPTVKGQHVVTPTETGPSESESVRLARQRALSATDTDPTVSDSAAVVYRQALQIPGAFDADPLESDDASFVNLTELTGAPVIIESDPVVGLQDPGLVEVYLPWSGDLQLTATADLMLAQDTPVSADATEQRITRIVLTSPRVFDITQTAFARGDDLFNQDFGSGARAAIGEASGSALYDGIKTRVLNAILNDPTVSNNPAPVVSVSSRVPGIVEIDIVVTDKLGQTRAIPTIPIILQAGGF